MRKAYQDHGWPGREYRIEECMRALEVIYTESYSESDSDSRGSDDSDG
jgi:hypothetical protein